MINTRFDANAFDEIKLYQFIILIR